MEKALQYSSMGAAPPAVTTPPHPRDVARKLIPRQAADTCGYISGDSISALTCNPGYECARNTYYSAAFCCDVNEFPTCTDYQTLCLDSTDVVRSCSSSCFSDSTIRKCSLAASPSCQTNAFYQTDLSAYMIGYICGPTSEFNIVYATPTSTGATTLPDPTSLSIPTPAAPSSTPGHHGGSAISGGAIAGIVIGSLAAIGIIVAMFFGFRIIRKRQDYRHSQSQPQPQPQPQPPMSNVASTYYPPSSSSPPPQGQHYQQFQAPPPQQQQQQQQPLQQSQPQQQQVPPTSPAFNTTASYTNSNTNNSAPTSTHPLTTQAQSPGTGGFGGNIPDLGPGDSASQVGVPESHVSYNAVIPPVAEDSPNYFTSPSATGASGSGAGTGPESQVGPMPHFDRTQQHGGVPESSVGGAGSAFASIPPVRAPGIPGAGGASSPPPPTMPQQQQSYAPPASPPPAAQGYPQQQQQQQQSPGSVAAGSHASAAPIPVQNNNSWIASGNRGEMQG